jgi:phosphohistidine phosphatase SixA
MGAKPETILTSPLDRAAETAAILGEVLGNAEVQTVDFLAPPADAKALTDKLAELRQAGVAEVALVGHAPSLDQCVSHVLIGSARLHLALPKSGAACVEWPDARAAPNGKPELRWLLRRRQLAAIAEKA